MKNIPVNKKESGSVSENAKHHRTKMILATSLKTLCATKPLSRITVHDIVEGCNMTRNTFYYHFLDKQELVNWIYKNECYNELEQFQALLDAGLWDNINRSVLGNLEKDRTFYINALNTDGQNCFNDYMLEMATQIFEATISFYLGSSYIDPNYKKFLITFYANAFTSVTISWLRDGMVVPKEQIIEWFNLTTTNSLPEILDRFKGGT